MNTYYASNKYQTLWVELHSLLDASLEKEDENIREYVVTRLNDEFRFLDHLYGRRKMTDAHGTSPPEGYRWLKEGEEIMPGDIFQAWDGGPWRATEHNPCLPKQHWTESEYNPVARKLANSDEGEEE